VLRHRAYRWSSVEVKEYKSERAHFDRVTRQTLIGDADDERATNLITRYFEIQPGGYSSLERHHHPHSVIVVRGSGSVILGDTVEKIGMLDCVYVAPDCFHQFHADAGEALGFLCIVDRERDRPRLATDEELRALRGTPEVARRLKR